MKCLFTPLFTDFCEGFRLNVTEFILLTSLVVCLVLGCQPKQQENQYEVFQAEFELPANFIEATWQIDARPELMRSGGNAFDEAGWGCAWKRKVILTHPIKRIFLIRC